MQLVVELEELVEVGKAVQASPAAFESVQRLIASSPSLADVTGAHTEAAPVDPLSERALAFLTENPGTWFKTRELLDAIDSHQYDTLLVLLKDLRDDGKIESYNSGHAYKWRAV